MSTDQYIGGEGAERHMRLAPGDRQSKKSEREDTTLQTWRASLKPREGVKFIYELDGTKTVLERTIGLIHGKGARRFINTTVRTSGGEKTIAVLVSDLYPANYDLRIEGSK